MVEIIDKNKAKSGQDAASARVARNNPVVEEEFKLSNSKLDLSYMVKEDRIDNLNKPSVPANNVKKKVTRSKLVTRS